MPDAEQKSSSTTVGDVLISGGKILGVLVVLAGVSASIMNFIDSRYVSDTELNARVVDMQVETRVQMQQLRQDVRRWMSCGIFQYPRGCEADLQRELSGFPR